MLDGAVRRLTDGSEERCFSRRCRVAEDRQSLVAVAGAHHLIVTLDGGVGCELQAMPDAPYAAYRRRHTHVGETRRVCAHTRGRRL